MQMPLKSGTIPQKEVTVGTYVVGIVAEATGLMRAMFDRGSSAR